MSKAKEEEGLVHRTSEPGEAVMGQATPDMGEASQVVITLRTASEIEAERLAFKQDRNGHNHPTSCAPWLSRITYMAHGKGYVMCRHPQCSPFVLTEKQWRDFPIWKGET